MSKPLLFIDIQGVSLSDEDIECLGHPLVAGVILFARNYQSAEQLFALCRAIKLVNPQLYIGVDQEGGRVIRLGAPFTRFRPLKSLGDLYLQDPRVGVNVARAAGELLAYELSAVGIDFSFAPVLDRANMSSSVIGDRGISEDVDVIINVARAYIQGVHARKMPVVGKHFPGHGGVAEDSHHQLPIDSRSFEQISAQDLRPFAELAPVLDAIMPAHVVYSAFDDRPACFSKKWLNLLRQQLGFGGVIFSDDLSMQGAASEGDYLTRARNALRAGVDYLLLCNNRSAVEKLLSNAKLLADECNDATARFVSSRIMPKQFNEFTSDAEWAALHKSAVSVIADK